MKNEDYFILGLIIVAAIVGLIILVMQFKTPKQICEENGGEWIQSKNMTGCWYGGRDLN